MTSWASGPMAKRKPEDVAEPEATKLRLYAQLGLRLPAELALRLRRYCQESGKSANKAVMKHWRNTWPSTSDRGVTEKADGPWS